MEDQGNKRLLLDLKQSEFVPTFNYELYDHATSDSKKCLEEMREANRQARQNPQKATAYNNFGALKIAQLERNKRVQLAYLSTRLDRIQDKFWKNGGQLEVGDVDYLHQEEQKYADKYGDALREYEQEICLEYNFNLTSDLAPPTEVFVQIRVLDDLGQVVGSDGQTLNLSKGSQQYVKKSDVERFINKGQLILVD